MIIFACLHCHARNRSKPSDEGREKEITGFRCGACHEISDVCVHSKMPDMGGGNPLSFQQCPDCQMAVYWDDGWQISGIDLPPNATHEQRLAGLVGAIDGTRLMHKDMLKKRSLKPIHCPHCGGINDWSEKEKTVCERCSREFSVRVAMRFRIQKGHSLPTRKKAWKMFAEGKRAVDVKRELDLGSDTAGKWHKLWRSGVQME